jgi:hypothetical protein
MSFYLHIFLMAREISKLNYEFFSLTSSSFFFKFINIFSERFLYCHLFLLSLNLEDYFAFRKTVHSPLEGFFL